jgi:DNA primase
MGYSLSRQQADLLTRHFEDAVLLLDGDEAGEHAASKIATTLAGNMNVYCGRVPRGGHRMNFQRTNYGAVIERATRIM